MMYKPHQWQLQEAELDINPAWQRIFDCRNRIVKDFFSNKTILNVGCGIFKFRELGVNDDSVGVDLDLYALKESKK